MLNNLKNNYIFCMLNRVASRPGISGNLEKSGNFISLEKKSGNFVKFGKVREF